MTTITDRGPVELHRIDSAVCLFSARRDRIPIILVLGPPGSGKGTICKQLARDFVLYHLSIGEWLREQAKFPIAGVPEQINEYVSPGEVVPEEAREAEYWSGNCSTGQDSLSELHDVPAPLMLYPCTKKNVSTPQSMKGNLMPTLKKSGREASGHVGSHSGERGSWRTERLRAVLLDNLTSNLAHAEAAATTFGSGFPTLAISIDCSNATAEKRFMTRGRGNDDAERFRRRIARFRKGSWKVVEFLWRRGTRVVEVSTEGRPVYAD